MAHICVHIRVDLRASWRSCQRSSFTTGESKLQIRLMHSNARTVRRKLVGRGDDDDVDSDNRGMQITMVLVTDEEDIETFVTPKPYKP